MRKDAVASVDNEDAYQGGNEKSGKLGSGANLGDMSAGGDSCKCVSLGPKLTIRRVMTAVGDVLRREMVRTKELRLEDWRKSKVKECGVGAMQHGVHAAASVE